MHMAKRHDFRPFSAFFEGELLQVKFPTQRVKLANMTCEVAKHDV